MPTRSSDATWQGDLKNGEGQLSLGSGAYEGSYSFLSRFEDGEGTNPEELIAAAHAGCYAMALSNDLASDGHEPERVDATANVHLDMETLTIDTIELVVEASVPGIDEATFMEYAEGAKENCPVSRVLAGAEISLDATLV
ncbi:OsmC family protein [Salinigranum halophilum]|mgnify:CR=1 FL=1|jgi:osmotically inducible protein OsmC|uniref:OsmC family protein n=1 Tax=Salinigranum halophilum TaxID=2565931 RepID=UPI0010A90A97|nr:OsmC family protein [Salinigranum halophilum]